MADALKKALDWLAGSFEFPQKPVAVINSSQRSVHADAHLSLTLTTMSARLVEEASIMLPPTRRGLDAEGIVADQPLAASLRAAMDHFVLAVARPDQTG